MSQQPTPATRNVAHGIVGVLTMVIVHAMTRRAPAALAMAIIAMAAHDAFDAPVAKAMATNGIQF